MKRTDSSRNESKSIKHVGFSQKALDTVGSSTLVDEPNRGTSVEFSRLSFHDGLASSFGLKRHVVCDHLSGTVVKCVAPGFSKLYFNY